MVQVTFVTNGKNCCSRKKLKLFRITLTTFKDNNRWITDNSLKLHPRYDAQTEETSSNLYRLDKDEEYSTLTTLWSNMAKLFKGDSDIDAQLRRQVVDLEPPVFSRKRRNDTVSMSSQTSDITEYFTQQTPWVSLTIVVGKIKEIGSTELWNISKATAVLN